MQFSIGILYFFVISNGKMKQNSKLETDEFIF